MIRLSPRAWRQSRGLSSAELARRLGLTGANPRRQWARYESGENACPAGVIARVEEISGGLVTAAQFDAARQAWRARGAGA